MLLNSTADIRKYISNLNKSLVFDSFASNVVDAGLKYIIPITGRALYDNLSTTPEASMTDAQKAVLEHVQRALAWYSLAGDLINRQVQIGTLGIVVQLPDDAESVSPAVFFTILRNAQTQADIFAEHLLKFLEENKADYELWTDSTAYVFNSELLMNSATELAEYLPVSNTMSTFLKIRTTLKMAEKNYVVANIGKAFLQDLKIKNESGTLDEDEKEVLDLCKEVVAFGGFADSIPFLSLQITADGLMVNSFSDGINKKDNIGREEKKELRAEYKQNKDNSLLELKKLLDKTPDSFPLYRDSEHYIKPPETPYYEGFDNEEGKVVAF
jgi:hypothetical protein